MGWLLSKYKSSGSIKQKEFLEQLSDDLFLKDSAPWSRV
jgi:hypothetical protein